MSFQRGSRTGAAHSNVESCREPSIHMKMSATSLSPFLYDGGAEIDTNE